jgi:hypothetical protein
MVSTEQRAPKRRPRGKPFVPGDPRINRGGVPAEAVAFQRAMREALAAELSKPSDRDPGERVFESMIHRLVALAKAGERWAIEMVLDRICGKPAQAVALTGEGGGPADIRVLIEHVGVAIEQVRARPQLAEGSDD